MPATAEKRKLDLSKLTDEEAKHVWQVVQRDFDLRRKEEDRLGELKSKIEKEDSKRDLLGSQTSLTESYCIRCLQPFKFLVNIKRQCLDCQLYVCKSCSRFSKREQGWVCDPCHLARVLKVGTLEWYHENLRARFKRFGSAKVMRSLFKRLSEEHGFPRSDHGESRDFDTQSMPEVHTDGFEEHSLDAVDSLHHQGMKKSKRRLTVDPVDFVLCADYSRTSRPQSDQAAAHDPLDSDGGLSDAMLAEADMAAVFQHVVRHKQNSLDLEVTSQHEDVGSVENRIMPSCSLSRLSCCSAGSGSVGGPRGGGYLPGLDDSEDDLCCRPYPVCRSSHASQDSLNSTSTAPQISDINRRMWAIENLLNRLEQKVTSAESKNIRTLTPQSSSPPPLPPRWEEVDLEEQQLRKKLHELTDNISDQSLESDDQTCDRPLSSQEASAWRSPQFDPTPSRAPSRPTSRTSVASSRLEEEQPWQSDSLRTDWLPEGPERKERPLQDSSITNFRGSPALLVELEDKVAQAAADVQSAQSQVSYIENRIAALNAAGIPADRRRRSAIPVQARRLSHNFPTKTGPDAGLMKRRLSIM